MPKSTFLLKCLQVLWLVLECLGIVSSTAQARSMNNKHIIFYFTLFLLGLGPQGPPGGSQACGSKIFSQTFPAMLLRLVGTADTAGDCEKPLGSQAHHCTPYMYFPPSQRAPSPSLHIVCSRCINMLVRQSACFAYACECLCVRGQAEYYQRTMYFE